MFSVARGAESGYPGGVSFELAAFQMYNESPACPTVGTGLYRSSFCLFLFPFPIPLLTLLHSDELRHGRTDRAGKWRTVRTRLQGKFFSLKFICLCSSVIGLRGLLLPMVSVSIAGKLVYCVGCGWACKTAVVACYGRHCR